MTMTVMMIIMMIMMMMQMLMMVIIMMMAMDWREVFIFSMHHMLTIYPVKYN